MDGECNFCISDGCVPPSPLPRLMVYAGPPFGECAAAVCVHTYYCFSSAAAGGVLPLAFCSIDKKILLSVLEVRTASISTWRLMYVTAIHAFKTQQRHFKRRHQRVSDEFGHRLALGASVGIDDRG